MPKISISIIMQISLVMQKAVNTDIGEGLKSVQNSQLFES
jgi:hypothetical protein